jgi:hypothetical protein
MRKINKQRALGMLLYHTGLSYEKVGVFAGASYEAVQEWYQEGEELFFRRRVYQRYKRAINRRFKSKCL